MQSLVSLKKQLAQQKTTIETSLTQQNNENTRLEKELVELQVQAKRETLIKELNTLKSVKKSDAIINQSIKDQGTKLQQEIKSLSSTETQIDAKMADTLKKI